MNAPASEDDRRAAMIRFLRFCCVGAAGFATDTGILLALVDLAGVKPIAAKALSFAVAVLVTFEFNRRWSFGDRQDTRRLKAFVSYLSVQGVGFLCNWVVFTAIVLFVPKPFGNVVAAAFVASAAALMMNYVGANRWVFDATPQRPS